MELLIIQAGRDSVGFVRFEKKGGALFFQGAEHRRQEDQGSFPLLLRDVAEAGSEESKIFLSLDAENIFFRELQLPIADRRKQREVLPLELKGETAIEVEKLVFDSLPLDEGRIMAIWAPRDDIEAKIASMREAGLEPQIVGSSLFHWQHLLPDTAVDGAVALSDGSSLAVYSQGKPVLFRSLDNGNFQEGWWTGKDYQDTWVALLRPYYKGSEDVLCCPTAIYTLFPSRGPSPTSLCKAWGHSCCRRSSGARA